MNPRQISAVASSLVLAFIIGCGGGARPGKAVKQAPAPVDTNTAKVEETGEESKVEEVDTPVAIKGTIGLSVLTLTNPFFKVIADNMKEEGAKHGYEVLINSGEFDVARQQNQVKDFIVKEVSAIVLCPCDSKAIGPAIQEANAAGIPVFTADIACLAPGAEVVSHIATDNLGGGRQAGEAMIEALGEAGGKIVILDYKSAESCLLRVQGFKEVINKHNEGKEAGKIEIAAELPGEGQKDRGYKCAEDALQAHGDMVGIFAINDPSALGARAALEKAGKADQVKIIGFDGQPDGKLAIREGKIYADPIQYPDRIGIMTVQTIIRHFEGEEVKPVQLIPTGLYRKADGEKDESLK
ncbi:MAG: substrate-binding domain-containing protein [Planctomycetota bacterium]|nr:substrate-binding domain-containing protein [Planctomycetota bacterium]MDA1137079.1 substrate-binding domain-containing protein [Planctomycetota bacterium]